MPFDLELRGKQNEILVSILLAIMAKLWRIYPWKDKRLYLENFLKLQLYWNLLINKLNFILRRLI